MELHGSPQLAGLRENSPNATHLKAFVQHTKAEHSPKLSLTLLWPSVTLVTAASHPSHTSLPPCLLQPPTLVIAASHPSHPSLPPQSLQPPTLVTLASHPENDEISLDEVHLDWTFRQS
ncbi:hypothetical protein E2C01_008348 [Portunus trituberculatus]|uniref:Uncharacterized protein n=1 Tax=Portunus trituberculatus TaxID=210409 RepID=A0A5B7D0J2_PORTR|nr:hypothetical protein [Portunus trituberculatus]